jgi:hypothetical protein
MFARLLFLCALALGGCKKETPVRVYIDNGQEVPATIRIDGKQVAVVPPRDIAELQLTAEKHGLIAVGPSGEVLDEARLETAEPGTWVFNIGEASAYQLRIVYYCAANLASMCKPIPPAPYRTTGPLFKMGWPFMIALPETKTTSGPIHQAQVVEHVPFHPGLPCCKRLTAH